MSNVYEEALKKHAQWQGKIETKVVCEVNNAEDLTLAYTPGVAQPCREIHQDLKNVYKYTNTFLPFSITITLSASTASSIK